MVNHRIMITLIISNIIFLKKTILLNLEINKRRLPKQVQIITKSDKMNLSPTPLQTKKLAVKKNLENSWISSLKQRML